jgi:hypothetical protein
LHLVGYFSILYHNAWKHKYQVLYVNSDFEIAAYVVLHQRTQQVQVGLFPAGNTSTSAFIWKPEAATAV